jgi:3',5'-cyclic AMP phosphodiesterase CpdA
VVAGNHDIPLYDLLRRALDPLGRYARFVSADLDPFFADDEIAVLGLNTARPSRWKDGRLSLRQIALIHERFAAQPAHVFKAIVTHHPFVPELGQPHPPRLERASEALAEGEAHGVELFLAGHLHQGYLTDLREHHAGLTRSILVAQAGTAVSNRHRGEPNGYNLLTVAPDHVTFDVRAWDGGAFRSAAVESYERSDGEWRRQEEKAPIPAISETGAGGA